MIVKLNFQMNNKRIVIERLYKLWESNPELRIAQLLWNEFGNEDFFYIEDKDFIKRLEEKYKDCEVK